MDNKKTTITMVRITKTESVADPTKRQLNAPAEIRRSLLSLVDVIKKLGEEQGVVITEENMAEQTGTVINKFQAYLHGEAPVPKRLSTKLLSAYAHLFTSNRQAANLQSLQHSVLWIRNLGLAKKTNITLKEMAATLGISPKLLRAFLRDEKPVPDGLPVQLESAYRLLLKDVDKVEMTEDLDTILGGI